MSEQKTRCFALANEKLYAMKSYKMSLKLFVNKEFML